MRKMASVAAASVALLGIEASIWQAASVPPGTPSKAVVVKQNQVTTRLRTTRSRKPDLMTGRFGYLPLGDGGLYAVKWIKVVKNQVNGIGEYTWGRMGSYRNSPVTILLLPAATTSTPRSA